MAKLSSYKGNAYINPLDKITYSGIIETYEDVPKYETVTNTLEQLGEFFARNFFVTDGVLINTSNLESSINKISAAFSTDAYGNVLGFAQTLDDAIYGNIAGFDLDLNNSFSTVNNRVSNFLQGFQIDPTTGLPTGFGDTLEANITGAAQAAIDLSPFATNESLNITGGLLDKVRAAFTFDGEGNVNNFNTVLSTATQTQVRTVLATEEVAYALDVDEIKTGIGVWDENGNILSLSTALNTHVSQTISSETASLVQNVDQIRAGFSSFDPVTGAPTGLSTALQSEVSTVIAGDGYAAGQDLESLSVYVQGTDGQGGLTASVTTAQEAIATIDGHVSASYGIEVDANGKIASMKLLSSGVGGSEIVFNADSFKVFNGVDTNVAPFEIVNGVVKIKSANIGTISFGDLSNIPDTFITTIIYADDANGTNPSTTQGVKNYVFFYNAAASWVDGDDLPTGAVFTKILGEDGYTPVKGIDYDDGIEGNSVRVQYSANGVDNWHLDLVSTDLYIRSEVYDPSTQVWTAGNAQKFVPEKGVEYNDGDPGTSSYLHIKYSDNGTTFTANNGETLGSYIGTYVDTTEADSTTFSDYTWRKYIGDDGYSPVKGIDYDDGINGNNVRFQYSANNTDWHLDLASGDLYIRTEVQDPVTLAWTPGTSQKFVPEKGVEYNDGDPGTSSYLHIKYSNNGTSFTGNGGEDIGTYIGTYVDNTEADSTTFADYTWRKYVGSDGYTPVKGTDYYDGNSIRVMYADTETGTYSSTFALSSKWLRIDSYNAATSTWTNGTPQKIVPEKDVDYFDGAPGAPGAPGAEGKKTASGFLYYQSTAATAPTYALSNVTYNFSTGVFTGLDANWKPNMPTMSGGTSGTNQYWHVYYKAVEGSTTDVGSVIVPNPTAIQHFGFTGIVTFSGSTLTNGTTTFNTTAIDGAKITTGLIKSADYSYTAGQTYTNGGMGIDLTNKWIRSKYFAVDENGASFTGGGTFTGSLEIDNDDATVDINASGISFNATRAATTPAKIVFNGQLTTGQGVVGSVEGYDSGASEGLLLKGNTLIRCAIGGTTKLTVDANGISTTGVSASSVTATGNITAGYFYGDGSNLTNLPTPSVSVAFNDLTNKTSGTGEYKTNLRFNAVELWAGGITSAVMSGARVQSYQSGGATIPAIVTKHASSSFSYAYHMVFQNATGVEAGKISVNSSSTQYLTSSDYRLKTNVVPMTGAINDLMLLNPVNFDWIETGINTNGFLAHEVQAVIPEAVDGVKDGESFQSIDQSKIVPLLTAALQEAITEINNLKDRIQTLENNG